MRHETYYWMVRHVESKGNEKKLLQGQKDFGVSQKGKKKATELSQKFYKANFGIIYSADQQRHLHTARTIRGNKNIEIITTENLRERTNGHFDGQPINSFQQAIEEQSEAYNSLPPDKQREYKYWDGYETDAQVLKRFEYTLKQIHKERKSRRNKNILIITSGGPIRIFSGKYDTQNRVSQGIGGFPNGGYVISSYNGNNFKILGVFQ